MLFVDLKSVVVQHKFFPLGGDCIALAYAWAFASQVAVGCIALAYARALARKAAVECIALAYARAFAKGAGGYLLLSIHPIDPRTDLYHQRHIEGRS